jgi:hypothetical protein
MFVMKVKFNYKHIILPHYYDSEVTCDNCDVLNFIDITNLVLWLTAFKKSA